MSHLPVVLILGKTDVKLKSAGPVPAFETQELDCRCYETDENLGSILARENPVVVITFGEISDFPNMCRAPFDVRRRWLHFPKDADLEQVGKATFNAFIMDVAIPRENPPPLITVFTPAYKTGEKIYRPFRSLLNQTYADWEWIVLDDSDDDGATFKHLSVLAAQDQRIGVFKPHRHTGNIGSLKRQAARLGRGQIVVELDHDDELAHDALETIVKVFQKFPEAGFAYSDCAEVWENGGNCTFGTGWGLGYGQTYQLVYQGRHLMPHRAALPNSKTLRHIVSSPNHFRAWRTSVYEEINGHSPLMHVADDYELNVRTFLATRMVQVRKLGYIQYYTPNGGNTQRVRNKDIQRLVRAVKEQYDRRIHDRLLELGCEDWAWNEKWGCSDLHAPNPEVESHAGLIWEP